jgi:hypothetical protein
LEYLFGVLPTTPFGDDLTARRIAEFVKRENLYGHLGARAKAEAVEVFYAYLFERFQFLRDSQPFTPELNGASLVLRQMNNALESFWNHGSAEAAPGSELDIV